MNIVEARACSAFFYDVEQNFLVNRKADNYQVTVEELRLSLLAFGCKKSIKLHVTQSLANMTQKNWVVLAESKMNIFIEM